MQAHKINSEGAEFLQCIYKLAQAAGKTVVSIDNNTVHRAPAAISKQIIQRRPTPAVIQKLLPELSEPCRTVVTVAVLTGLRIGEILALRWKRVDLLRDTIEVAETFRMASLGHRKLAAADV